MARQYQRQGDSGGVISPDLATFFDPYGQQAPNQPLPPDESEIARLLREMAPGQEGQLNELVRRGMTKGLGTTDQGQLNFSQQGGGAVGYNGPLRPSDVPAQRVAPLLQPEVASLVDEQSRIKRTPLGNTGKTLGDVMDALGAFPKGIHPSDEAQQGVLNQVAPGLVKDSRAPIKITIQERAAHELSRRASGSKLPADPLLGGLEDSELKIMMGIESKPKAGSDIPKVPNSNTNKYLTDTYNAEYEKAKGTPAQRRSQALKATQSAAEKRNYDAKLDEGFFTDSIKAVERSGGGQVGGTVGMPAGAVPTNRTIGGKPAFKLPNGKYWTE